MSDHDLNLALLDKIASLEKELEAAQVREKLASVDRAYEIALREKAEKSLAEALERVNLAEFKLSQHERSCPKVAWVDQQTLFRVAKERDSALAELASLAYEIEGGNGWPVEWEDRRIGTALRKAKAYLSGVGVKIPEWLRNGPGWKRAPLSSPAQPLKEREA